MMIKRIITRIINYLKKLNCHLVYEGMMICLFCKYWGVVNWCNLYHKPTCGECTCDKWRPNNE